MNRNSRFTFAQLDAVLKELGLRKKIAPKKAVVYKHDASGAMVILRLHKPDEIVPDYVMAAARLQLDEFGVIEKKDFDEMLQAAAA